MMKENVKSERTEKERRWERDRKEDGGEEEMDDFPHPFYPMSLVTDLWMIIDIQTVSYTNNYKPLLKRLKKR